MTERKIPPPDDKGSQEASPKDETTNDSGTPAKEDPADPNTPSTNESQDGQPQPNDDLLEKIKWAKEWIKNNPKAAAALGLTAGGLTVVAAPALLTGPVLSFMGFGSSGIVGGSFAAAIQGMIGNVVAGSWFATATSAAMGGYGVPVVAAVGQGVGAAAAVAGGAYATKELRKEQADKEGEGEGKDEGGENPKDPGNDGNGNGDDGTGTEEEKASRWRQSGLGRRDFDDESTLLDDSDSETSDKDWL
ncbi:hypothetical protein NEUTE1DRAFT_145347 [Neurospora tetrasperma FGSC 2508]|uniref:Uncharacterized protein n=1 Tax=Neurospora tetrasperma (strain FGSC 2508 / ATCC MYA-4615 / P0657) TaxID=510951 RepID=F8MFS8_NEUT8|nr:uncharacterized protein NEUTE1DRAFT_145347 [Neurospora tetrasperma FGSC 2508]EGO59304.1 hypothetical protein NEUTE1DRAFT_145347 [Neurospora tetrasperma FGSC 2508]EGZ73425.1 hypothetical protein NEUTE2DRAFT_107974 [Neurospora tetrasperma FGSC 2509]